MTIARTPACTVWIEPDPLVDHVLGRVKLREERHLREEAGANQREFVDWLDPKGERHIAACVVPNSKSNSFW